MSAPSLDRNKMFHNHCQRPLFVCARQNNVFGHCISSQQHIQNAAHRVRRTSHYTGRCCVTLVTSLSLQNPSLLFKDCVILCSLYVAMDTDLLIRDGGQSSQTAVYTSPNPMTLQHNQKTDKLRYS